MKNFPHQISDFPRLVAGLRVFDSLSRAAANLGDDRIVGEALARAEVYSFRGKGGTVEDRIRAESGKDPSNQGFRTAARDLRRLFELLGFVRGGRVTPLGERAVGPGPGPPDQEVRGVWRQALLDLTLDGSHPYAILVRLASEARGVQKPMLALCLEARDDSQAEFDRVLGLARIDDVNRVRVQIGATPFGFQNAQKILPSLAVQLGDARLDRKNRLDPPTIPAPPPLGPSSGGTLGAPAPSAPLPATSPPRARSAPTANGTQTTAATKPPARLHRSVTAGSIAVSRPSDEVPDDTVVDLSEAIRLRKERSGRHNEIVRKWARLAEGCGCTLQEDPYDCLALTPNDSGVVLAEIKTLLDPPDPSDEREQVRAALGQLLYYEEIDLAKTAGEVFKVGVFSHRPSAEHIQLLNRHAIGAVWLESGRFLGDARVMGNRTTSTLLESQPKESRPKTLETDW